jgi:cellulose synthase operon protein C
MMPVAEEAWQALTRRYGAAAELPIRVEVYPHSADFSVRTVGLAGLGALGVAFGSILAMDSPAARDIGDFNWGSTLWHEISHAITLGASNSRVPRWLTEGIAVLDERRAREGWGEGLRLDFLAVLKQGRLLPVSGLNAGFVRPTYPGQVMHAYFQASLVAELIEQLHGERALRDMLRAYAQGRTTAQVFREVLRTDEQAFDARFEQWIREKYATQLGAITVTAAGNGAARARRGPMATKALAVRAQWADPTSMRSSRRGAHWSAATWTAHGARRSGRSR